MLSELVLIRAWAFQVVFLVPKVPLVVQQANVFEQHTPLSVRGYYGDLGVDNWDRSAWIAEFQEQNVCTWIISKIFLHLHMALGACHDGSGNSSISTGITSGVYIV